MYAIPVGSITSQQIGKAKVVFEWASAMLILALASFVAFRISMMLLVPDILLSDQYSKVAKATDGLKPRSEVAKCHR